MVHTSHLARHSNSLPLTTTLVERMFSSLKLIKTDRHTSMSNTTLSDLMEVYHEGPSIQDFHADTAIQLWWERCQTNCCPNQGFREQYRARKTGELTQDDSTSSFSLEQRNKRLLCRYVVSKLFWLLSCFVYMSNNRNKVLFAGSKFVRMGVV